MKRIKAAVGFGVLILFFLLLFLFIITLNVTYGTLALALFFGSFLASWIYLEKVKKYRPLLAPEKALYLTEISGVVLMLLSIAVVGYENSYIYFFVRTQVWYIWISGVFIFGLGECARRSYRYFHFKRGIYPKKVEETLMEAKSVTLAPMDNPLNVNKDLSEFIKKRLIQQKLTLRSGQKISINVFTGLIPFEILETDPEGNVKVTKETTVKILSQPAVGS